MEYVLGVIYFVIFFCMLVGIAGHIFLKEKEAKTNFGGLWVVMVIALLAVQLARWMI